MPLNAIRLGQSRKACQIQSSDGSDSWRLKYFRSFVLTLLGTGIRPGEALGLRWGDIDLSDAKGVVHICGTAIKPAGRGSSFRQPYRKHARRDQRGYYLVLPMWLSDVLRERKSVCRPADGEEAVFQSNRRSMATMGAVARALDRLRSDSSLEWLQFGNFRDTAATHVRGRTGDASRASAQLGHAEGSSVATRHYIDRNGYIQSAVDNSNVMEELKPTKVGAKLESATTAG